MHYQLINIIPLLKGFFHLSNAERSQTAVTWTLFKQKKFSMVLTVIRCTPLLNIQCAYTIFWLLLIHWLSKGLLCLNDEIKTTACREGSRNQLGIWRRKKGRSKMPKIYSPRRWYCWRHTKTHHRMWAAQHCTLTKGVFYTTVVSSEHHIEEISPLISN